MISESLFCEWMACIKAGYPLIFFFTVEEERALDILEQVSKSANRNLLFPRIKGETSSLAELLQRVDESDSIVVLDNVHSSLSKSSNIRLLADAVSGKISNKTFVILCPCIEVPRELECLCAVIELPLPKDDMLKTQCVQAAADLEVQIIEEELKKYIRAVRGLTSLEAFRIVKKALVSFPSDFEGSLSLVIREKKAIFRKSRVLESVDLPTTIHEVGGMDRLKDWLISRQDAFSEEARHFGLPAPRGILLMGIQGCGKSLMAKAVAHYWRLPLTRLDISSVFGSVRPESVLREALMTAEAMSPTVLWIDEIEKGFGSHSDGVGARLLGKMVTWLQEKQQEVFVVATANRVANLPPELPRKGRFDEVFFVDLPDVNERCEILSIHLLKRGRNPNSFNLEELAKKTDRFTGSELEQLVISGLFHAYSAKRDLCESDLLYACKEMVPLFEMYEEEIKSLREWARKRARSASTDRRKADLFSFGEDTVTN